MGGIEKELIGFAAAVVTGGTIRLGYECSAAVCSRMKKKKFAENISDFLFWILSAVYMFRQVYRTSNGSIRWYFILGVVFGVFVGRFLVKLARHSTERFFKIKKRK